MRIRKYCITLMLLLLGLYDSAYAQEMKDSVKIYFRQGKSALDVSVGNNRAELSRIADSLATSYADSVYQLKTISVIGSASPEGSVELNKRLSEKRANVLFDYLWKTPRFIKELCISGTELARFVATRAGR